MRDVYGFCEPMQKCIANAYYDRTKMMCICLPGCVLVNGVCVPA